MKFKHYLNLMDQALTLAKGRGGVDAEDIMFLYHLVSLAYEDKKVEQYEADILYDIYKTEKRNLEDYLEAEAEAEEEFELYCMKLEEGLE